MFSTFAPLFVPSLTFRKLPVFRRSHLATQREQRNLFFLVRKSDAKPSSAARKKPVNALQTVCCDGFYLFGGAARAAIKDCFWQAGTG
jgi:hypothetical protein